MLLLFQGAFKQFLFFKEKTFYDYQEDFHIFLLQLEYEMDGFEFQEIKNQTLTMSDKENQKANFQHYREMIRKSYKNGHHPLLMNVKNWQIKKDPLGFQVEVTFINQQTFEGRIFKDEKED